VLKNHFNELDFGCTGYLTGPQVFPFFSQSEIDHDVLASIWELSDITKDAKLDQKVFYTIVFE
jgi:hypothetical protein